MGDGVVNLYKNVEKYFGFKEDKRRPNVFKTFSRKIGRVLIIADIVHSPGGLSKQWIVHGQILHYTMSKYDYLTKVVMGIKSGRLGIKNRPNGLSTFHVSPRVLRESVLDLRKEYIDRFVKEKVEGEERLIVAELFREGIQKNLFKGGRAVFHPEKFPPGVLVELLIGSTKGVETKKICDRHYQARVPYKFYRRLHDESFRNK